MGMPVNAALRVVRASLHAIVLPPPELRQALLRPGAQARQRHVAIHAAPHSRWS